MTIENSETLKQANYMQLSPRGDLLVYVLDGEIWLVATRRGSDPRKLGKGNVPLWSPDGKRLAYYASDSGTSQLFAFDLESGHAEQLTHLDGGINPDLHTRILGFFYDPLLYGWSPDGTKLVFASQVVVGSPSSQEPQSSNAIRNSANKAEAPLVLTAKTPPQWTLSGIFAHDSGGQKKVKARMAIPSDFNVELSPVMVNQLFIVDINDKKLEQLTKDQAVYFNPDWSPDGRKIVCASSEGRSLAGFGSGTTNIYVIDIAASRKIALTTGPGDKRLPHWSPDGKWVSYLGAEHLGIQSVFVISSKGGKPSSVTSRLERNVLESHWSSDSRSILFNYVDGVSWSIARVNVQTGRIEKVISDEAAVRWPTTVSRSDTLAWQQSDASTMGVIRVLLPAAHSPAILVDLNPQIREWKLGEQEIVRWTNHHGEDMEGILIFPVGYREAHKYPVIVDCYPGVQNAFFGFPLSGNQALASRGYAVFYPNARTPYNWVNHFKTGKYDEAGKGPKGWDVTVDDVMSGVDELIRRGIADPDRIGLFGFSNGGGVVNYLVTRTNRFKCAVSVSPSLPDWILPVFLHTTDPMIPAFLGGITPWEDPEAYIQLSAVFHMEEVTTPMLLAEGDDSGEWVLGTIEIYNGLRWFGRDVTLLRYPNQGHGFTGWALKDFSERENSFFDEYLKPDRSETN